MIVVLRLEEVPFFDLMVCFTKPGNESALDKVSNLIRGEYDFSTTSIMVKVDGSKRTEKMSIKIYG